MSKRIAKNIMRTAEFPEGKSVFFDAKCSCQSDNHNLGIIIEADESVPSELLLNFYYKVAADHRTWHLFSSEIFAHIKIYWQRIKQALRILFTGYLELDEVFILEGEEQIRDFAVCQIQS